MDDSTLLKIALSISLVGLTALYIITETTTVPLNNIAEIDMTDMGKDVSIQGRIVKVNDYEKTIVLAVEDTEKNVISVILFKDGKTSIQTGLNIIINGEVEEYNGQIELIANEIIKI